MSSVHQEDDGENIIMDVLAVDTLVEHPGYDLSLDDPDIYSDSEDFVEGVTLCCEWPDRPLPKKKEIPEVSQE